MVSQGDIITIDIDGEPYEVEVLSLDLKELLEEETAINTDERYTNVKQVDTDTLRVEPSYDGAGWMEYEFPIEIPWQIVDVKNGSNGPILWLRRDSQ